MKTEQRFSSVFSLAEKASLPQVNLVRIKSGCSKRSADDFFIRRNVMLKFCLTVPVLKDAEEKIIFRIEKLADECIGSAQERYFPTASIKNHQHYRWFQNFHRLFCPSRSRAMGR
ncbi:hypothetical protein [Angelakisella massiliensis]|uniref:hypothetical protein n=1 Tax=Angelakisella massiliensis TaxID=1871018 RepID=UPI0024B05251|nr:hypothetical protein [Angelakisella massiliensis]